MSVLSNKIVQLRLNSIDRYEQILEICSLLNEPQPIASLTETRYKLKPLLIPHLLEEGILIPEKLQAIATHPICSGFLTNLINEHYDGATELSPSIQRLLAAARTFGILTESEVIAVRDRLDIEKMIESDKAKPIEKRRYQEWNEEVPQPPVSWAIVNLGRSVNGYDIEQVLGELSG